MFFIIFLKYKMLADKGLHVNNSGQEFFLFTIA